MRLDFVAALKRIETLARIALSAAETVIAANVGYTAAVAGNWQPNPTNVKAALDQLAAPNTQNSLTVTGGGTANVTVGPTPLITKKKSGHVLVTVTASVVTQNAGDVTCALNGSASGTIANGNQQSVGAGDPVLLTLVAPDTILLAGSTYQLNLASGGGAGNLTVVGSPVISVTEIG